MTVLSYLTIVTAALVLMAIPGNAGTLTLGSRVQVSTDTEDFNISVFPGKAGYEGDDESPVTSGTFGDCTVLDYHFFNSPNDSVNSYADGGGGLVSMASSPSGNINGGGESWSDLWTTNDPGVGFSTSPNFTTSVNTFARSANISGSIDISELESGTVYFPHGTFINQWALTLTMTGPGQASVAARDAQTSNGPNTNFGWITDFNFSEAASYDTITYTYTNQDSDGSRARFMGVIIDGIAVATSPPSVANSAATDIRPTSATIGGEVTDSGGGVPAVTLYWGDHDGGTSPGVWDNAIAVGGQAGSFSSEISGLSPATTYFFRAFASNRVGEDWADATATFSTDDPPSPPTAVNRPATMITGTAALVGGDVTSTGGDPPAVTIYFGDNNGATDADGWDDSVELGIQNTRFTTTLSSLSPLTTYYFRARVQNAGGTAWAPATASFTTLEGSELIINEFMAANDGGETGNTNGWYPIADQVAGTHDDWIEILNAGTSSLDLNGWHLTDDFTDLTKWSFSTSTIIPAGGYLVVYASGSGVPDANGNLHTTFALSADGEYLALVRPDLTIASEFDTGGSDYPGQGNDISYGLHPFTSAAVLFSSPTPGAANDPDGLAQVADTKFSPTRQLFTLPFDLVISSATPSSTIHYTLDGSAPTTASPVYAEPISITSTTSVKAFAVKDGLAPTNIDTHTYLSLQSAATQPANPPGVPTSWGGASADYEVDPEVTGTALPGYSFEQALLAIPSMAINTAAGDLFGSSAGIYNNSGKKGRAWERQASLEFIDPNGGEQFQIDCGVAAHGASSRGHGFTKKHSLRLLFKEQFGARKLEFPVFEDAPTEKFDLLILRACSTDSWPAVEGGSNFGVQRWRSQDGSYQRDQWMRDTQVDLGHDSARGRYVHLYLNGLYWGVYNLVERPNSSFHSSHFGGEDEDWDVIHDRGELQSGDFNTWNEMFALADAGLASDAAYMAIQGRDPDGTRNQSRPAYLDLDHFIDYMLFHIYAGAEDWPCHNYWTARRRAPDSEGFRFYVWDQEISNNSLVRERTWCDVHFEVLESDVPSLNSRSDLRKSPAKLYYQLRQNAQFRDRFANRVHHLLFNGGLLSPDQSHARWMRRATEIDQAIVGESARWGDSRLSVPHKRETRWIPHQDWLRDAYWPANHDLAVGRFRNVGLYPSIGAPVYKVDGAPQHGGMIEPRGRVSITNTVAGSVTYFTTDGSDPRQQDGSPSPAATLYSTPLVVTGTQRLQTRSLIDGEWSALVSALFTVDAPLRVTEIMYHPQGDEAMEYIELMNISERAVEIAGYRFDGSVEGIEFTFHTSEAALDAGARIVVVRDQTAFALRYGLSEARIAIGDYDSSGMKLSNDGEQISLRDPAGGLIQQFTYNDTSPWPELPDGAGPSLVLISPNSDPDPSDPASWRASSLDGGRPGSSDSTTFTGDPNADLDGNGVPDLADHALADGGELASRISGDNIVLEYTREIAADDVIASLQLSTDLSNWTDGASTFTLQSSQHLGTGGLLVRFEAPLSPLPAQPTFARLNFQLVE